MDDKTTTFADIAGIYPPWTHRATLADLEGILASARNEDILLIQLDGSRMKTLDDLFNEFFCALSFPESFRWNWFAFADCMSDLAWLPARRYLTIVTNADLLLSDEPEEIATFMRQLDYFGRYWAGSFGLSQEWGGGEVPFHTVFSSSIQS